MLQSQSFFARNAGSYSTLASSPKSKIRFHRDFSPVSISTCSVIRRKRSAISRRSESAKRQAFFTLSESDIGREVHTCSICRIHNIQKSAGCWVVAPYLVRAGADDVEPAIG